MSTLPRSGLVSWLEGSGGRVHPSLDLFAAGAGDRGVKTTGDIAAGEVLVFCPLECCLGAAAAPGGSEVQVVLRAHRPPLSPFMHSCLTVLHQIAVHGDSFEPYTASLPEDIDVPLGWTAAERAHLTGLTSAELLDDRRQLIASYRSVMAKLAESHPVLFPKADEASFLRVAIWIRSRAFTPEMKGEATAPPLLVPGIDMANHAVNDVDRVATMVTVGTGFALRLDKAVQSGAEVLQSYGAGLTNAQLLWRYGFVAPHNPNRGGSASIVADDVRGVFGDSGRDPAIVARRLARLDESGIFAPAFVVQDGEVPVALMTVVQVLLMDADQYTAYDAMVGDPPRPSSSLRLLGRDYLDCSSWTGDVLTTLLGIVAVALDKRQAPPTLEDDQQGEVTQRRVQMAGVIRDEEMEQLRGLKRGVLEHLLELEDVDDEDDEDEDEDEDDEDEDEEAQAIDDGADVSALAHPAKRLKGAPTGTGKE